MVKKVFALLLTSFIFTAPAFSQSRRVSIDVVGGIPITFASIPSGLSTFGGLGIRYNLTKEISIQGIAHVGALTGKQIVPMSNEVSDAPGNYIGFTNNFFQYSGNVQFNLERIFGLRRSMNRLNPYLFLGAGYINSSVTATRMDGRERKYRGENFYNGYGGLSVRYYVNPEIDLLASMGFHFTESYFLDGIPTDQSFDQYLMNSVGVSYKVGAKSDRQHIEWNNVILKSRILIPDLEKRHGQPVDEDGNFIMFNKDSIEKIQVQNKRLADQNRQQQDDINKINDDVDNMQQQVDQLRLLVDQMKKQGPPKQTVPVAPPPAVTVVPSGSQNSSVQVAPPSSSGQQVAVAPKQTYVPSTGPLVPPVVAKADKTVKPPVKTTPSTAAPVVTPPAAPNKTDKPVVAQKPRSEIAPVTPPVAKPPVIAANPPKAEKSKPAVATTPPVVKEPVMVAAEPEAAVPGTDELNDIDGIVAPVHKYNVIVGAYTARKFAFIFRDKLRNDGYSAAIFKSRPSSRMLRIAVVSTDDKSEAIRQARKARKEIDPGAWIHIYNAE